MRLLLIVVTVLVLISIPIGGALMLDHYVTQQCYAECHTDTECEACDR